ncbi:hypothetical protein F3Y22_tig00002866pilonHSYRG00049 [Hibiscus syriacus]|uniref:At2g35280-like TPR domain-containing protein n=1 Tax=Hibiscus syriacus TaxID=106335 RepID=A0A6A3CUM5_HIBSY|nr:hypothetical protein F3Y22_tig00002866pilonHSYRG00049 [Hibiscus syriacus]
MQIRETCKAFCEAAKDEYIFSTMSLHNYGCLPWKTETMKLLEKALMANNPQALYREGMVKCFCDVNYDVDCGVRLLREASDRGVIEATYALGLQLICIESRASEGYRVLQDLDVIYFEEGFDVITRCRRVTNRMIADIWTTSQLEPLKRVYCPCIDDPDRSSDRGVIEATYALGLQLICIESRASEGYRVLQDLDAIYFEEGFDVITRCRRVTSRMIADIWTTSQLEPLKRVYCPCIDDPDRCSYCFWNY